MRRPFLNSLRQRLEAALTAVAFAEENDLDTARQLLSAKAEAAHRRGTPGE